MGNCCFTRDEVDILLFIHFCIALTQRIVFLIKKKSSYKVIASVSGEGSVTLHTKGRGLLRAILFLPPFSPVSLWLDLTFPSMERPEEMVPQGQGGSLARVHSTHT